MNDKDLKDRVNAYVMLARTGRPEVDYDGITNAIMALIAAKTIEARISGAMELAIGMTVFNDNQAIKDYGVRQFKRLAEEKAELQTFSEKGNQ